MDDAPKAEAHLIDAIRLAMENVRRRTNAPFGAVVTREGKIIARDYNHAIEEEAYSTGAAALVPYTALKRMVEQGRTTQEIARHFAVSRALVEYRIKVSRLWDTYKTRVFQGK